MTEIGPTALYLRAISSASRKGLIVQMMACRSRADHATALRGPAPQPPSAGALLGGSSSVDALLAALDEPADQPGGDLPQLSVQPDNPIRSVLC